MNDILKLGVRLFLFSLIAAAALAVTNEVTKGPIAEQKLAAQKPGTEECRRDSRDHDGRKKKT